jgi:hypothetical protein
MDTYSVGLIFVCFGFIVIAIAQFRAWAEASDAAAYRLHLPLLLLALCLAVFSTFSFGFGCWRAAEALGNDSNTAADLMRRVEWHKGHEMQRFFDGSPPASRLGS